jgi:nucleotide-binding universal stress UspA family protein
MLDDQTPTHHPNQGRPVGPILFAYDGSEQARASIREAARQLGPGRYGIVLTVWEPLAAIRYADAAPIGVEVETDVEGDARRMADEGARLARSFGFEARPLVDGGDPVWRRIVDAAEEHDASILVLGSHGRSGIGRMLLGSVAEAVTRHSKRPVLIAHAAPGELRGERSVV